MDGRYLSFFNADLAGSVLSSWPLEGSGDRKPIEVARSTFRLQGPRISPDGRLALYVSNPSGRLEAFVRPFNAAPNPPAAPAGGQWQVSDQGSVGMAYWNRNGKELYYLAPNRAVMAVSVTTSPQVEFGKPRMLFSLTEATPIGPSAAGMSRDGERVVMAVPPPQLRQLTLLDREGKSVGHRRTAGNLRTALAVTRWHARGGHEEQSTEWKRGHLDVRSGDRPGDRRSPTTRRRTLGRSGLPIASRWPTCRRAGATPASTERRQTERARKNCCSATHRAPG